MRKDSTYAERLTVYGYLCDRVWMRRTQAKPAVFPDHYAAIAQATGLPRRLVIDCIEMLDEMGRIRRRKTGEGAYWEFHVLLPGL